MRKFKLVTVVSDRDWPELNALMVDPRQTINSIREWLAAKGYSVSRGAVHHYRRALCLQNVGVALKYRGSRSRAKWQLNLYSNKLSDDGMAVLALFAAFLAGDSVKGMLIGMRQFEAKKALPVHGNSVNGSASKRVRRVFKSTVWVGNN